MKSMGEARKTVHALKKQNASLKLEVLNANIRINDLLGVLLDIAANPIAVTIRDSIRRAVEPKNQEDNKKRISDEKVQ